MTDTADTPVSVVSQTSSVYTTPGSSPLRWNSASRQFEKFDLQNLTHVYNQRVAPSPSVLSSITIPVTNTNNNTCNYSHTATAAIVQSDINACTDSHDHGSHDINTDMTEASSSSSSTTTGNRSSQRMSTIPGPTSKSSSSSPRAPQTSSATNSNNNAVTTRVNNNNISRHSNSYIPTKRSNEPINNATASTSTSTNAANDNSNSNNNDSNITLVINNHSPRYSTEKFKSYADNYLNAATTTTMSQGKSASSSVNTSPVGADIESSPRTTNTTTNNNTTMTAAELQLLNENEKLKNELAKLQSTLQQLSINTNNNATSSSSNTNTTNTLTKVTAETNAMLSSSRPQSNSPSILITDNNANNNNNTATNTISYEQQSSPSPSPSLSTSPQENKNIKFQRFLHQRQVYHMSLLATTTTTGAATSPDSRRFSTTSRNSPTTRTSASTPVRPSCVALDRESLYEMISSIHLAATSPTTSTTALSSPVTTPSYSVTSPYSRRPPVATPLSTPGMAGNLSSPNKRTSSEAVTLSEAVLLLPPSSTSNRIHADSHTSSIIQNNTIPVPNKTHNNTPSYTTANNDADDIFPTSTQQHLPTPPYVHPTSVSSSSSSDRSMYDDNCMEDDEVRELLSVDITSRTVNTNIKRSM